MCGRYYVDDETSREIRKILEQLDATFGNQSIKKGEIFPTDKVPVLTASQDTIKPEIIQWGFPNNYNKGVLINARSETATEKKTFRDSILNRRCVIPSNGFYEWDKNKKKYYFHRKDSDILYMAGFYQYFGEECKFIILTTAANESMAEIHHRMPLILESEEINNWILDNQSISFILNKTPVSLLKEIK